MRTNSTLVQGNYIHMQSKNGTAKDTVLQNPRPLSLDRSQSETSFTGPARGGGKRGSLAKSESSLKCGYAKQDPQSSGERNTSTSGGSSGDGDVAAVRNIQALQRPYAEPSIDSGTENSGSGMVGGVGGGRKFSLTSESENSGDGDGAYMYMARQVDKQHRTAASKHQRKVDTLERPLLYRASETSAFEDEHQGSRVVDESPYDLPADATEVFHVQTDHYEDPHDHVQHSRSMSAQRSLKKNRAPAAPASTVSNLSGAPTKPTAAPPAKPSDASSYESALRIQQRLQEQQRLQQQRRLVRRQTEGSEIRTPAAAADARGNHMSGSVSHSDVSRSQPASTRTSANRRATSGDARRQVNRQLPSVPVNSGNNSRLSVSTQELRHSVVSGGGGGGTRQQTSTGNNAYHSSSLFPPTSQPHPNMASNRYPPSHSG